MEKPDLILFTNGFPYRGGEPFLETEIEYLASEFNNIRIFPTEVTNSELIHYADNIQVVRPQFTGNAGLKNTLRKHGFKIAGMFISEFIQSPMRWKYISEFRFNLYRLIGLIHDAELLSALLKPVLKSANNKVYSYWFNDNVSRLVLTRWFGLRFDILTRVHLYDFEEEFNQRGYLSFRYCEMKKVQKVIPISDYASGYLREKFPGAGNIAAVSRLGARDGVINPGANGAEICIVTCSSLTWYKRPLLLVDFIAQFKNPVHWIHFGDGNMQHEFLTHSDALPSNIRFEFKGQVGNSEILKFYSENGVDVLLNLSNFEGIPFSMMEAISAGIPLVGCNICGVPEIVTPETGYLLPVEFNAVDYAGKVEQWILKTARGLTFRTGIMQFAETRYSAGINYPKFITENLH